jgi:hypothetical protein
VVRYVGRGRHSRVRRHFSLLNARRDARARGADIKPHRFYDRLEQAIDAGQTITVRKIAVGISGDAAARLERDEISKYHPDQLWNSLLNRFPHISDAEHIARVKEAAGKRKQNSSWRASVTEANRRKASDPQWIESHKRATEARVKNSEWRENSAKAARARAADPQWRKRLSDGVKEWASRPEVKAMLSAANKRAAAVPGRREKNSEGRKANWQDPEYRARYSTTVKAKWRDDLEFRDKMLKNLAHARAVLKARRTAARQK